MKRSGSALPGTDQRAARPPAAEPAAGRLRDRGRGAEGGRGQVQT